MEDEREVNSLMNDGFRPAVSQPMVGDITQKLW